MKKIKNVMAIAIMAFGLMITTNACRDPCKDVNCNNGTCNEGTCDCETGYEGTSCETAMNAKFVGTYNTTDNCAGAGYSQSVTAGTSANQIVFSNLGNFSSPAVVRATVSGTSFTVTDFADATGRKFTVNGSISGTTISGTYKVVYTDGTDENCTISMTR